MNIREINSKTAIIQVNIDEMLILNNSVNTTCNALVIEEFPIRIGGSRDEARKLLAQISAIIDQMSQLEEESNNTS